jgi:hypothetical protein
VSADKAKRGSASEEKTGDEQERPVSKGLLFIAWLIPGLGHWLLGKRVRAAVFAGVILAAFVTGVLLDGELAVPQQNSPLSWFFSFGCLGNGILYVLRLLWVNGLDGLFSAAFPYGLQGGGDPVAAGFFYGKTFLYTAGLMNLLVVLDVHDIARGDKS